MAFDFAGLAQQCAPTIAYSTLAAIVKTESNYNPYAIGVVGGRLARQPQNLNEALVTVKALEKKGRNFSVGLSQINRYQLAAHQLSYTQAFDPCANLKAGSAILQDCYLRAQKRSGTSHALHEALSCYYAGNFTQGFKAGSKGQPSYVQKVLTNASALAKPLPIVPDIVSQQSTSLMEKPNAVLLPEKSAYHSKEESHQAKSIALVF